MATTKATQETAHERYDGWVRAFNKCCTPKITMVSKYSRWDYGKSLEVPQLKYINVHEDRLTDIKSKIQYIKSVEIVRQWLIANC